VPVENIAVTGGGLRIDIGRECPALWHGFHRDETTHRWTDGRASLPPGLLGHFTGEITLDLRIGTTDLHYPIEEQIREPAADVSPGQSVAA
jgi:hypothetical protein